MWLELGNEEYNNNRRKGKGMTKSGRRRKAYSGACWKERVKNQVCRDDRWDHRRGLQRGVTATEREQRGPPTSGGSIQQQSSQGNCGCTPVGQVDEIHECFSEVDD